MSRDAWTGFPKTSLDSRGLQYFENYAGGQGF